MIDLHCHILPKVDDGSQSMEETIDLLKSAEKAGFSTICFTPHYAEPGHIKTIKQNQQVLEEVQNKAKEEEIFIKMLLGNEIFISENMGDLLENNEIATLANSHYALIELPMYQELPQEVVKKLLDKVKQKGFQIVIAHPERYQYLQKKPKKIEEYFEEDIIFQSNYASIIGAYGKDAKKTLKKFLKDEKIHYLSSDVHHINRCFYEKFDEIKKKLLKILVEFSFYYY